MLVQDTNKSERWGTALFSIRLKRKDKVPPALPRTPNKGLHAYTEADKVIFFGREKEIEELKNRIQEQPLTVVTGSSGIGKSSLIQAGLIPQLREDSWNILPVIRPGTQPMRELEKQIDDLSSLIIDQQATLLVIDAYEELITQTKDPSEQSAFVQQLADWLETEYPYLSIVIIVDSDLEEQVPKGDLSTSWRWKRYEVPPLTWQQIYAIISQMALYAELEMGEEFAARIIDDLADLETPLPHFSYALSQVFEKKLAEPGNRSLRLSDYIDMGQVGIAIHLQLENIYAELGSGGENLIRMLFEMVSFDTDIPTPKPVSIYELGSRSTDELNVKLSHLRTTLQPIAERLVEAGLLISGLNHDEVKYYEPAHEVLLSAWPRLVAWIEAKGPGPGPGPPPPEPIDRPIDQRIWDEILDSINRDNCVLILGPGAMVDHTGYPLQTRLRQAFANQVYGSESDVPGSLLDLGDQPGRKSQKIMAVEDVYRQNQVHDIYSLLAYIPFSLILSTSPDTLMHQAFEQQGIDHQFEYYNYKEVNEDISYPSKESPLIYNVFGSWRDYDSLILSNRDLFDFLFRILGDSDSRSLPAPLKEKLSTAHSFVFLGFDFYNKEYDLLLRLFNTHQKDVNFAFVNQIQLEDSRRDLLEKHFHIEFVEHNPLDFIRECYQRCSKVAILREISRPSLLHQVSRMLKNKEVNAAFEVLHEYFQDKEEEEEEVLFIFAGRYSRLQSAEGKIPRADFDLQLDKITRGLLEIAEDLDSRKRSAQTVKKPSADQISTLIQAPFTPLGSSGQQRINLKGLSRSMSAADWHELLDGLENQSSILVLGPGASVGRNGEHLHNKLCSLMEDFLDTKAPDHPDKLFVLGDKIKEGKSWQQQYYDFAHRAFSEAGPHEIHEKLTFIPFHLIINTSPDNLLQQSFHQLGTRNHVAHYNYKRPSALDANPSDFNPLIYNLFGSLDDEDSLVMNHDHLFEFMFSLLGSNPLPSGLRKEIRKANHLVFLGVDSDSWYVKLLLYVFEAHDKGINYAIQWRADSLTMANSLFYVNNFQMDFVDGDVESFVNELYNRCIEKRLVREPDEDAGVVYPFEELQELIEKNDIEGAILFVEDLSEKLGDEDITSEALVLSGRYRRLNRKEKAEEAVALERAKIIDSLLELAKELDDRII